MLNTHIYHFAPISYFWGETRRTYWVTIFKAFVPVIDMLLGEGGEVVGRVAWMVFVCSFVCFQLRNICSWHNTLLVFAVFSRNTEPSQVSFQAEEGSCANSEEHRHLSRLLFCLWRMLTMMLQSLLINSARQVTGQHCALKNQQILGKEHFCAIQK